MIRMSGTRVYFYSHKFSDDLLDGIAKGIVPLHRTQIQKFAKIDDRSLRDWFHLTIADDRAIIFQMLDSIQQIISKMWSSILFWIVYLFSLLFYPLSLV